jgi:hypothetical protein
MRYLFRRSTAFFVAALGSFLAGALPSIRNGPIRTGVCIGAGVAFAILGIAARRGEDPPREPPRT